jgi:hypothetical protein
MDTHDDETDRLIATLPFLEVWHCPETLRAAVVPELQQNDLAAEGRQKDRPGIQPVVSVQLAGPLRMGD